MPRTGVILAVLIGLAALAIRADEPAAPDHKAPSVKEARQQAELLHVAMHATLHVVHHEYYREDEGLRLPAAMMRDVFDELRKERNVALRWLAVEGVAMSTDHKPGTPFEHAAVKALTSGQTAHESVENGVYRRAAAITLTSQCLKCHVPDRKSTRNRTAGLIIAMPVTE